jgi:Tol biopolymer transport system component
VNAVLRSILFAGALVALTGCHAERLLAFTKAFDAGGTPTDANGDTGDAGQWPPCGTPQLVTGLRAETDEVQDPSMTFDELELYFMSPTGGLDDIWVVRRSAIGDPWGPSTLVMGLSSPQNDQSPDVSVDGLTMFFASDRGGDGLRIYVSQRRARDTPWEQPVRVDSLGASALDESPTVDRAQLYMVFTSQRGTATERHLYAASRPDASAAWQSATELTALNSATRDTDPALFAEGRALVFASRRSSPQGIPAADLFQATRSDVDSPFASPILPLSELNAPLTSEQDPWLSQDGRHLLFASNRNGPMRIYECRR